MRKTQLIIKKFLIFMLVILPLTMSFITPIKSVAIEATPIDLRMYDETSVNAPVHTHIWTTKFDEHYHWEECSICRNTRNKTAHVLAGNGGSKTLCENGYYNQAYRETCSCGFQSKPQVIVHGRYENYVDCKKLNYGTMTSQTFDTLMHVSYAEFQDLLNGTNNSGKNPDNQQLPTNVGGQAYTWHEVDSEGLGLIFMGGPIIGNSNGIKGTLEMIIGSEGDCGKHSAFDEYFILARYIYSATTPTRAGFISYMENDTPNAAYINNSDHMLYGYPNKYRNRVTDAQWNQIVEAFKGYYTHTSNWGWGSMNIQHAGHANAGSTIYGNAACYDSSNHHAFSTTDGIKTNCDICNCNYAGNETYIADTWFNCAQHQQMADGETKRCTGHVVTGKNDVKLGTIYCNYSRTNGVTTRTSITAVPEPGFTVIQDTTVPNVEIQKLDTTNPSAYWTYYGTIRFSNQQTGDALISRGVQCGLYSAYIDTVAPTAYGYSNNQTNNSYWKVTGKGTQTTPRTQSSVTVTFKDPQEYSRNVVSVKVYDSNQTTVIPQGNGVTETPLTKVSGTSGADTLWQGTINIMTEVNGSKNIYVQAIDSCGRKSALIPMQISYIDAQGPTLTITADKNNNTWATSKTLTVTGSDDYTYFSLGISTTDMVQVANSTYNNQRKYEIVGDVYNTARDIRFYAKDVAGNLAYKDYSITRIDNTKPTITNANVTIGNNSSTVDVIANDINTTLNESGSGVSKYAISTTNTSPGDNNFQTSNRFTIATPGRYYVFAQDAVGNTSTAYAVTVPIKYNLTINPNGGKYNNSSSNTVIEVQNSTSTNIAIPTRVGYNFTGWTLNGTGCSLTYSNNSLTQPAVFNMGAHDASLTANWEARNDTAYKVRHWKQNIYDNTNQSIKNEYNTHYDASHYTLTDTDQLQGTSDTIVRPAVKTYTGFTSPEREEIRINADGSRVLDYYYTRNEYSVDLNGDNGINELFGERDYLYKDSVEIEATVKPGYEWEKWQGNQVSGPQQSYTFDMPANAVEENASTTKITYNLTYLSNDPDPTTAKAVMATNPTTYNVETNSFTINNPTRTGYNFTGWTVANGNEAEFGSGVFKVTTLTQTLTIPKGTYGNLTLTAHWQARNDTVYTVQHWQQNIYDNTNPTIKNEYNTQHDATHYTLADTDELEGTTDTTVTPNVNTYEGFTSPARQDIIINADGSRVLNYYYTRNEYDVVLVGENGIDSVTGARKYLYDASVRISATVKRGYSWDRWEGNKVNGNANSYIFAMPAYNVTETAYTRIIIYNLTYLSNDTDPTTAKAVMETNPTTYNVETENFTLNNPTRTGYDFIGWTTEDVTTPSVTTTINKGTIGDKTFTANWRARTDTQYKVQHWKQKIYDNQDEAIKEYCSTNYNETVYELTDIDELEGTTDARITPNVNTYTGFTSPEAQEIVIDANGDTVLNYYYKRNEYNLKLNGDNGIKELFGERKYLYDDLVEMEATIKPGYTWKKWEGNQVSGTEQKYIFNMPANDVEENATTTINEYTIRYNANDEESTAKVVMPNNAEAYNTEAENIIVNNPTRDGYVFTGWTVENDETTEEVFKVENPTKEVTIPTGTYGNLTFTANWEEKGDTQYKVQHWRQRIYKNDVADNGITNASIYNEENYELVDTDELEGITDRTVEPDAKEYEGFTSPAKRELLISGDGTSVMNYYYTRNYYKLTVDKDEYVESTEGTGIYLYGENVKVNCKTAKGYSFKEWQGDKEDMQQEDYVTMPANDTEIKALSQKNKHQIKIDLGDKELVIDVEYDDVITIDSPEKEGYEFLYFETNDGEKIYDNKLHIEDKDYVIKPVWSKIPTMSLPKTGEQNSDILLILYSIITIMAFGTAIFFASKTKE